VILEQAKAILKKRSFVSVATCDKSCEPHAAPKFVYKIEGDTVLLIDHTIAKTVDNLRLNPRVSISFMDLENLEGYRVAGPAELIEKGPEFDEILKGFEKKLLKLSADRLIEGMKSGKVSEHFELEIPTKMIAIKIKVKEAVRIGRQGELFRETAAS
jgi:hypothetical protein